MNTAVAQTPASAKIEFPEAFQSLFTPARYKVFYGGRGGAKSWAFARALLLIGAQRPIRVLCAREFQNSIQDSVHKLLSDQIIALGLGHCYEIKQHAIVGANGTEFGFEGIRHNVNKIKSYEGVDVCWVEEAVSVTRNSWNILIPTIRKPGSEIWISFNPELETDETFQRFVKNSPSNAIIQKVTWRDNPWFPQVLYQEMQDLKARDQDSYLNVWEGNCRQVLDGAIFAQELRDAQLAGRIGKVPYDPLVPVDTFWDLGWADSTSIWFAQAVGFEYHLIDFYENSLQKIDHYLQVLQRKPYVYGTLWLPHDARAKEKGSGKSIEEQVRAKSNKVRIVPNLRVLDGINAARTIFPNCYFDEDACSAGINHLRHFRWDIDPGTGISSKNPLHDEHSHCGDAFRYFSVAIRQPRQSVADKVKRALGLSPAEIDDEYGMGPGMSIGDNSHSMGWLR